MKKSTQHSSLKIVKDPKNAVQPLGGIHVVDAMIRSLKIDRLVNELLGERSPQAKFSYTDVLLNLCYLTYIGGNCLEDAKYLKKLTEGNRFIKVADGDTLGYVMKQLAVENEVYKEGNGVEHEFNRNERLNELLLKIGIRLHPEWKKGVEVDYDNVIIETEKWDSAKTYKKVRGYQPGVAFIGRSPIYVEGRNGNTSAKTRIGETIGIVIGNLQRNGIAVKQFRSDAAGYTREVIELLESKGIRYYIRATHAESILQWSEGIVKWEEIKEVGTSMQSLKATEVEYCRQGWDGKKRRVIVYGRAVHGGQLNIFTGEACEYFAIITNDRELSIREVLEKYNERGTIEKNFDILKNDLNWSNLPFSEMKYNVVFMIFTGICYLLYDYILKKISCHFKDIKVVTRLKGFILRFMNVCGKWIKRGREHILKLYTDLPYELVLARIKIQEGY